LRVSLLVKLIVPLVIVAGLGGYFATKELWASSNSSSHPRFIALSLRGTAREYRTEAASLRLAPGWTWPRAPVPPVAADGRPMRYEKGWGTQAADFYWYCSWSSRAIDSRVGASARQKALEHVLSIREKYFFKTALALNTKPVFDQMLKSAAHGDLQPLRRSYELNCPRPVTGGVS
jgi:hypothetical protein